MGRSPRSIPPTAQGTLVEITGRTIGARALLVPGPNPKRFNELIVGLLGRAMDYSPIELCACVFTSNHYHLLAAVYDQQELSRFMFHFAGNTSRKIGKLRQWEGAFWHRRYDSIRVSDEPEAQWARLKYALSHGVKEGLVESPLQWPGVHAAGPLLRGKPLRGTWFNKTQENAARNRGEDIGAYDFATKYQIELSPLPTYRHLEPEAYRQKVAELIVEIQDEGKAKHEGNPVAGVQQILGLNPYEPPTREPKASP
ncbi:MAG: transposase, partial [Acidobacteriota bacterium]